MRCVSRLPPHGPARRSAWPHIRPRLSRRLCLVVFRWEGDTRLSDLLVAESEPEHDRTPGLPDIQLCFPRRVFGAFLQGHHYRLARSGVDGGFSAAVLLGAGTPGKSRTAVSPPPGDSASWAVPPLEVTRRCTMARPSPVPFGFEVVKRRKARSRSSALMPGPSSATVTHAPAAVDVAVTMT